MILLVDNRDSYTFNLAHLIAAVAGEEPEVVRSDDVDRLGICERVRAGAYSHVVISPGPGTPSADEDFGGSRAVIEAAAGVPLLGVCLGHQGLAHLAGADVERAEPHHGHVSTLRHSGEGIFAGVPQGMRVVRYHSLHVTDIPGVRVHARSEDGVVQALEVLGAPHWGVQFHPESVLTEHGDTLMRNFLALAPAGDAPRRWGLAHEAVDVDLDTEATFRALTGAGGNAFWLDSATGEGYSIMASGAGSLTRTLAYSLTSGGDVLAELEAELAVDVDTSTAPPLPFTGGWVGYLTYECAALTLPGFVPRHANSYPDACFVRPQSFLVYDHAARRAHLMALYQPEREAEATRLVATLKAALRAQPAATEPAGLGPGSWRLSREEYLARIAAIKAALARGDSYEVCLTDTYEAPAAGRGLDLYSRLRRSNPAPYAAYLALGDVEVLSSSPERFLRVRDRAVEAKPIKGTIPRDQPPSALRDDAKTRAENLMIVDLLRNDLSRVCTPGSVSVPKLMHVETYATVHQLVSTVTGQLRPGASLVDLVRAAFPPGSMTGAPKERTCAIIDELEAGPRGVYSGVVGYLGFDGSADLSVVIRTAVAHGDTVRVGAGGAIVWASDAHAEYAELLLKARAVIGGLE
ncbi:aminodeoxychorismate synthase component I [Corynebacterium timonense]|uniref:aminodeoxychorismate synthase n=1 Tax=Corynebacterium timonense TaxID=441500 RepID=A0A1H1MWP4_9CORY|nr:aminodeoxychorismate synthase component I [Corynebacterium timonense]SDR90359.1 para-aminobenzoate synthetase [Corynebacterium timonense]